MDGYLEIVEHLVGAAGGFDAESQPSEQARLLDQGEQQIAVAMSQIVEKRKGSSSLEFQYR